MIRNVHRPEARHGLAALLNMAAFALVAAGALAGEPDAPGSAERFHYLSAQGNSNCSAEFLASIPKMSAMQRLQGSCCGPMAQARYAEQIEGLKDFSADAEIPPDPYDIPAGLAQKALANFDLALTPEEQKVYDYAMANSEEQGPCCCRCWRWKVYGGLAKYLIRTKHFTGPQITQIWNLSDGCGGES
jgi:hypothetical protein